MSKMIIFEIRFGSTFIAVPPIQAKRKLKIMHALKQAELSKLNGILVTGKKHCIKFINKYPWLVVKGNLQGC